MRQRRFIALFTFTSNERDTMNQSKAMNLIKKFCDEYSKQTDIEHARLKAYSSETETVEVESDRDYLDYFKFIIEETKQNNSDLNRIERETRKKHNEKMHEKITKIHNTQFEK